MIEALRSGQPFGDRQGARPGSSRKTLAGRKLGK